MSPLLQKVAWEWEKALCWAVAAVFVLMLVAWFTGFIEGRGDMPGAGKATPYRSILSDNALAFLDPVAPAEVEFNNPFRVETTIPGRPWQVSRPARVDPPPVKVVQPDPPKVEPPPPVKVAPPAPKPRVLTVGYLGSMTTTSGRRVAHVVVKDSQSGRDQLAFAAKGEKVGDVTVVDFGDDALEFIDPNGRKAKLSFGERTAITIPR